MGYRRDLATCRSLSTSANPGLSLVLALLVVLLHSDKSHPAEIPTHTIRIFVTVVSLSLHCLASSTHSSVPELVFLDHR
jgi:hypothetical protein